MFGCLLLYDVFFSIYLVFHISLDLGFLLFTYFLMFLKMCVVVVCRNDICNCGVNVNGLFQCKFYFSDLLVLEF